MPFLPEEPKGPYQIKGIPVKRPEDSGIRQELRDFKENKPLWNLYLLGYWQFQLVPMEKQLSYFQIAGIHGLPPQAWPISDPNQKADKTENFYFCTHSSILFLTWHRPYMALFESTLQQAMLYVAKRFTEEEDREKYVAAAEAFRMPYWDWARTDREPFPVEATDSETVTVHMPKSLLEEYKDLKVKDGLVEIPNPLYSYKFQFKGEEIPSLKVDSLPQTTRHHTHRRDGKDGKATDKLALLTKELSLLNPDVRRRLGVENNIGERMVYILRSYKSFDQVSHNGLAGPNSIQEPIWTKTPFTARGRGFGSLEDVHNVIHGMVGGPGGQMGGPSHAAFDPIFWLHHTNIDRLISIWQGLNYDAKKTDTWVTPKNNLETGKLEDIDTYLEPFYKDDKFFTSDQVRDTTDFGYVYPETQHWKFATPKEYQQDIKRQLDERYVDSSLATMITAAKAGDEGPEQKLRTRAKRLAQIAKIDKGPSALTATAVTALALANETEGITDQKLAEALPTLQVPTVQIPDGRSLPKLAKTDDTYLEWLVNIKAVKHALDGQYQVHVFLGPVSEEESTGLYQASPYHVGTFIPFGQAENTACNKCKKDQQDNAEITGQIPLTIALAERYFAGELESLTDEHVPGYLKSNLHWRVIDENGAKVEDRSRLGGLLVGVVSNKVTLPNSDYKFPHYSQDITVHPEITTKQGQSEGRGEGTGLTDENKNICHA